MLYIFGSLLHNHYIWPPTFYLSIHLDPSIQQNFHNIVFHSWLKPFVHTIFQSLLYHISCTRSTECSSIPYYVFSCNLSELTYCNYWQCVERSPRVICIIYSYMTYPCKTSFWLSWFLMLAPGLLITSFLFFSSKVHVRVCSMVFLTFYCLYLLKFFKKLHSTWFMKFLYFFSLAIFILMLSSIFILIFLA